MNKNLIPNDKELEQYKKEILIEMNMTDSQIRKERKQKILVIMIIIALIILFIKIFFGTIEINNILGYPSNKANFYKVTINNREISVDYNLKHKIPIIPYLINFNSIYRGGSIVKEDADGSYFYPDNREKYIIDIDHTIVIQENIK